jgi:hypothetical protein
LKYHTRLKLASVRVEKVGRQSQRPIHLRQQPFSLLFIAPGREKLNSGIYEVEHPEIGDVNLFLHEVGADQDLRTVHYEAVFN